MTEITLNREFEEFYCPITGKQVLLPDDFLPSPALMFIYVEEIQGFVYTAKEIRTNFPEYFDVEGESVNGDILYEILKRKFYIGSDKILITYGIGETATMCFDMAYEAE